MNLGQAPTYGDFMMSKSESEAKPVPTAVESVSEISWFDEHGTCHRMSIEGARKCLARFWEEWPGGWSEVEAEKEARKKT